MDARSWSLGGSGVASAQSAHALTFNPALLSSKNISKKNQLILQLGIRLLDDDNLINSIDDFTEQDFVEAFENSVDNAEDSIDTITDSFDALNLAIDAENLIALILNADNLNTSVDVLTEELANISSKIDDLVIQLDELADREVLANTGTLLAAANPGRDFGWGVYYSRTATLSGILTLSQRDVDLLNLYQIAHDNFGNLSQEFLHIALQAVGDLELVDEAKLNPDLTTLAALRDNLDDTQDLLAQAEQAISNFNFSENDIPENTSEEKRILFENGELVESALDPDFESSARFIGIDLEEIGIGLSKEFNISGFTFAAGITPKIQLVEVFDYIYEVDDEEDFDIGEVTETGVTFNDFNFDLGFSKTLGNNNQYELGAVIRNLIPRTYETINAAEVELNPLFRIGAAYNSNKWLLTGDLDVTENKQVGFEDPTQYISFGSEYRLFKSFHLRSGIRSNLIQTDDTLYSLGFGAFIWNCHIDFAAFSGVARTENNSGIALELGYSW